jgi:hypothetical protein
MCKLSLRLEVWGYCILSPPARTNTSTLRRQARVCVAAISNRLVFLQNWDAPFKSVL